MDLKGKIKAQGDYGKRSKQSPFTFYPTSLREPLSDNRALSKSIKHQKEPEKQVHQVKDEKDEKIKQLYDVFIWRVR